MSDVFISYAREDLPRIKPIVTVLQSMGWSVWWDRTILPGQVFEDVIRKALESARCVVVAWSVHAVDSDWVKAEAEDARQKRILVPCLLDDVRPPLVYRAIQAANLIGWAGAMPNAGMQELIQGVAGICTASLSAAAGNHGSGDVQSTSAGGRSRYGRVLEVDRSNPACDTIRKAIGMAAENDRVLIQPGVYRETFVMDKVIELAGAGDRDAVIIESADDNVIWFDAAEGCVVNLTIRYTGTNHSAVRITRGRLRLTDCDLTSRGLSCISIQHEAQPVVRRNRIHDGRQEGIYAGEDAAGIIEDNKIYGNGLAGVAIWRGASPTVRGNEIYGCREGVYVGDRGRGVIEGNKLHDNAGAGIKIAGGNPSVGANEEYRNHLGGF